MAVATQAAPPAVETPSPRSRRRPLLLVAVVLTGLAAGWWLLLGPGSGGDDAPGEPVAGEVLPLEPITMNLADGRLLKVGLALQLVEGAGEEHPVSGSVALDEAITYLGGHSVAQLTPPEARQKAKAELSKRVAERYHHEVLEVYFTEFVMQ